MIHDFETMGNWSLIFTYLKWDGKMHTVTGVTPQKIEVGDRFVSRCLSSLHQGYHFEVAEVLERRQVNKTAQQHYPEELRDKEIFFKVKIKPIRI